MKPGSFVRLILLGTSLALAGIGCYASENGAGGGESLSQSPSHSGSLSLVSRKWSELPIPFFISNNVPERFVEPILDGFSLWEEAIGTSLFSYQGKSDSDQRGFDGRNVIYWSLEPSQKNYLGETFSRLRNEEITLESDIVFYGDPNRFASLTCGGGQGVCKSDQASFDITTTVLHEIGHFLGLEHRPLEDSIMNPDFGLASVNHRLDGDLVGGLQSLYNRKLAAKE